MREPGQTEIQSNSPPVNNVVKNKPTPKTNIPPDGVVLDEPAYSRQQTEHALSKIPDATLEAAVIPQISLPESYKNTAVLQSLVTGNRKALKEISEKDEASIRTSIANLLPVAKEKYQPFSKIKIDEEKLKKEVAETTSGEHFEAIRNEGLKSRDNKNMSSETSPNSEIKTTVAENIDVNELGFVKNLDWFMKDKTRFSDMDINQLDQLQKALATLLVLTRDLSSTPIDGPKLTMAAVGDVDEAGNLRMNLNRRRQDVKEIEESEFFQDLAKKAKDLRNARNNPTR